MSFKVNVYDPQGQAYAPRITHQAWEKHRAIISQLHATKTPRKVMLKRLRDDYDFTPTLGQLQAKCKEWNLKVYAKEGMGGKAATVDRRSSVNSVPTVSKPSASPAFHLAAESGFVEEWSDDYRIHPIPPIESSGQDRSLPPEYIGGGLLANTVDSHWPVPQDDTQCERMLLAAHFYQALHAFQQSFSIFRAVYLYQRRFLSICDPRLIKTVLHCACSAVTNHQRNIMHSVLCEVGSSAEIDTLGPLVLDCLQSASLNMISSDITCDIESGDLVRARATAYLLMNSPNSRLPEAANTTDLQALLYKFEHALLMQEHESRILQHLLSWCESAIDRLHRQVDDIFVGHTTCEDEYHRRVSQVLSGYLLSQWHKPPTDDHDDQRIRLMQQQQQPPPSSSHATTRNNIPDSASCSDPCSFRLHSTTTQTLVALAFVIVDAVRCDPLLTQFNTLKVSDEPSPNSSSSPSSTFYSSSNSNPNSNSPHPPLPQLHPRMWFLDAAKLFKRGIRMLCRLDDRSRCAVFAEAFLERFYTPVSYRQRAYHWTAQLPAIVDSVGISLAQDNIWLLQEVIATPEMDGLSYDREIGAMATEHHDNLLHHAHVHVHADVPEAGYDVANTAVATADVDDDDDDVVGGAAAAPFPRHHHSHIELHSHSMTIDLSPLDISGTDSNHSSPEMHSQSHGSEADSPSPSAMLIPPLTAPSPTSASECNSIASFMNTYHRNLKRKFDLASSRSGRSTPGDVMSLTSSTEFKFGVVANCGVSANCDVDSLWQVINATSAVTGSGGGGGEVCASPG